MEDLLFPEVEYACPRGHEDVSVLWEMTHTPQSGALVCLHEVEEGGREGGRERGGKREQ